MKAAKDPHFIFYPMKEGWRAVAMAKKLDTYGPPGSRQLQMNFKPLIIGGVRQP